MAGVAKKVPVGPKKLSSVYGWGGQELPQPDPAVRKRELEYKAPGMFTFPDPTRHMGIEVEVERCARGIDNSLFWHVKDDGSLRNQGVEFTTWPINGELARKALYYLFEELKARNPKYHFSPRTSIHVHMNVRDLNVQQYASVVALYASVEGMLYDFVGKDRDRSVFCVPLQKCRFQTNMLKTLSERGHISGMNKYMGMNLLCTETFGTIEFRHMPGTDDQYKILQWIALLQCLFVKATTCTYDEVLQRILPLTSRSDFHDYLTWLFGAQATYLPFDNVSNHLQDGCRFVKMVSGSVTSYMDSLALRPKSDMWERLSKSNQFFREKPNTEASVGVLGEGLLNEAPEAERLRAAQRRIAEFQRETRLRNVGLVNGPLIAGQDLELDIPQPFEEEDNI